MSAALSGGQEITSAFSRSLYYATPWIHPLSHTREQKGTYTSARARALSSNTLLTSSRVRVRARSLRAGRISENDSTSHTRTRGYLSLSPRPPPPAPPAALPPTAVPPTYACPEPEIRACTHAACVPRGMAEIPLG